MRLRWTSALLVASLWGAMAQAQGILSGPIGPNLNPSSAVKGLPFSADVTIERTRVLADGNRIHQETHGKMYRDAEGRIRNESELVSPNGGMTQHVMIADPVKQVVISLDPQSKTAIIHNRGHKSPPNMTVRETPLPPTAKSETGLASSEDLGTMDIEGVTATGRRHTRTIEAGAIGNEKPLVSTTETWMSSELRMILLSKIDDPQSGQITTKLVNIQRIEPDPLLFQVPPDYTVREPTKW